MSTKTSKMKQSVANRMNSLTPEDLERMRQHNPVSNFTPATPQNTEETRLRNMEETEREFRKSGEVVEVPLEQIVPNPWQPRTVFNDESIQTLADSIRESGLLQPIIVRRSRSPLPNGAIFQLIAGERRLRAHKLLGNEAIKVIEVMLSDEQMAYAALTENLARESLTGFQVYRAIEQLQGLFPTRKDIAAALGISRTLLYRYLSYEKLPDFILKDLEVNPNLMAARTAELITSVLTDPGPEISEPFLRDLWDSCVQGKIASTEIPAKLQSLLSRRGRKPSQTNTLSNYYFKGLKLGNFRRVGDSLTLSIGLASLNSQQEAKLEDFLSKGMDEFLSSLEDEATVETASVASEAEE